MAANPGNPSRGVSDITGPAWLRLSFAAGGNMKLPVLLAHGEGLISYMSIVLLCGAVGLVSLIASGVVFFLRSDDSRRMATRFFLVFVACLLLTLFAPLIIQVLHLP